MSSGSGSIIGRDMMLGFSAGVTLTAGIAV